jgi:hypothetical protein
MCCEMFWKAHTFNGNLIYAINILQDVMTELITINTEWCKGSRPKPTKQLYCENTESCNDMKTTYTVWGNTSSIMVNERLLN